MPRWWPSSGKDLVGLMYMSMAVLSPTEITIHISSDLYWISFCIPVVTLTYSRQDLLIQMIKSLEGVRFLHKVIIIWNNPDRPTRNFKLPSIGVPIEVMAHLHWRGRTRVRTRIWIPNPMATVYYVEHVHIPQTQTRIPTLYFYKGQESEFESVNVNEP